MSQLTASKWNLSIVTDPNVFAIGNQGTTAKSANALSHN